MELLPSELKRIINQLSGPLIYEEEILNLNNRRTEKNICINRYIGDQYNVYNDLFIVKGINNLYKYECTLFIKNINTNKRNKIHLKESYIKMLSIHPIKNLLCIIFNDENSIKAKIINLNLFTTINTIYSPDIYNSNINKIKFEEDKLFMCVNKYYKEGRIISWTLLGENNLILNSESLVIPDSLEQIYNFTIFRDALICSSNYGKNITVYDIKSNNICENISTKLSNIINYYLDKHKNKGWCYIKNILTQYHKLSFELMIKKEDNFCNIHDYKCYYITIPFIKKYHKGNRFDFMTNYDMCKITKQNE